MEAKMSQSSSGAPGWQLQGNAPLADDRHTSSTSPYRTTRADLWKSPRLNRVIACWTPRAALAFATRLVANKIGSAGQVVGFDLNAGMLARARASRETAAAIEWRLGNATDMPFADATF